MNVENLVHSRQVNFTPVVFDVLVQLPELLQLHNDGDDG